MSAAPLLSVPIQLCTYSVPRKSHTHAQRSASGSHARHFHVAIGDVVRLSHGCVRRRRGLVVVLEQGVEIALMDLHTQTPVHTYTLAPSDRVCTPPLVVEWDRDAARCRTTYVGVVAGADTEVREYTEVLDARGRPVHADSHPPQTFVHNGRVTALYVLPNGALAAHTDDGHVSVRPRDGSGPAFVCDAPRIVHDVQVWDASTAHKLDIAQDKGALVMIGTMSPDADEVHMLVLGVHESGDVFSHTLSHGVRVGAQVVSCAVHMQHIAVLTREPILHTLSWKACDGGIELGAPHSVALRALSDASVVYVSPSHLLIVAVPAGEARIAALLWDTELDAVLAVTEWGVSTPGAVHVSTAHAVADHVFVQVDPHEGGKCTVAALPVSVPKSSQLRHALGAAQRTAPWLREHRDKEAASDAAAHMLGTLARLPRDGARFSALDAHFRDWLAEQSDALREATHTKASRKAPKVPLDAVLVERVMDAALPDASAKSPAPYARDTVRYLVERGAVSTSMVPDLVPRARLTHDWSLVFLLLRHVPDMSESHAVALLHDALVAARDDPAHAPAVPRVLQHMLLPPAFSKAALRVALRTHIKREDESMLLLDILSMWMSHHMARPGEPVRRMPDTQRVVPHTQLTYRTGDVQPPAMDVCLSFMEDLFDTFFPQWLGATHMHAFLRDATRQVTAHAHAMQALARLSGPLAAIAHAPAAPERDARSKRLALHEASLLVPTYSVDTLDM